MSDSNHLKDILSINEGDVELEKVIAFFAKKENFFLN